jgi:DNA-binding HxlR family transcriptional regulator
MKSYGQFCWIARALELLGERWTLLVVRELLCGSRRFSDIRRGIPRVSRTMLSARLRELLEAGVIVRSDGDEGAAYALTPAGEELSGVVRELGTWGQRRLPRTIHRPDVDADALLWDVQRRVRLDALPPDPLVVRLDVGGFVRFLLLRRSEASLCTANPGFPERLAVRSSVAAMTAWWRGDVPFREAQSRGLSVTGPRPLVRAFPTWFLRYVFADVAVLPSAAAGGRAG